jgi:IPT/TIG domain-containing protein
VNSSSSLTAFFQIDPAEAPGPRAVTVTTAGGTSGPQTFTVVTPPPPTLTSVSPNQGIRGTTVTVTLTGTDFVIGASTSVVVDGSGVAVVDNSVTVNSSTSLTARFAIDVAAAPGPRAVTVTTVGGTSGAQTFTVVTPPPPTLTSVSPDQGVRGTVVTLTLTGTNFVAGQGGTTVLVGALTVPSINVAVHSSTSLTAVFLLDVAAAPGPRPVTVTTGGGTSGAQTFTVVTPPPPTLTSVSPDSGIRGTVVTVALTGTNFVPGLVGTTVSVGGVTVPAVNLNVNSSTSITIVLFFDVTAVPGPRAVTVTTAGGTSGAQTFTVT